MSTDFIPPPPSGAPVPNLICPQCGTPASPGEAFCSNCGGSLAGAPPPASSPQPPPAAINAAAPAPDFSIGIWGPKSSGKTMYLCMLDHHLRKIESDWEMSPNNDAATKFVKQTVEVIDNHRFPDNTAVREPEEYLFRFKHKQVVGVDTEYVMRVLDMPGEWYQNPENATNAEGVNILENYLASCSGLLCLIDPDRGDDEPMLKYLVTLLQDLHKQNNWQPTDKKLAFCLTKMDMPGHRNFLKQPEQYIHQKLGDNLLRRIRQYSIRSRVRFDFACSSVGFLPGSNPPRSNSGLDWQGVPIIYDTRNIHPFSLFKPLEWLFGETV